MKRKRAILLAACIACLAAFATGSAAAHILGATEAPQAGFSIPWWTVDSGGGTSTGGTFSLSGTIGQPDAGVLSGGTFTLKGGFWGGTVPYVSYIPMVRK